jgi:polyisoprenoid-binding protein YceI
MMAGKKHNFTFSRYRGQIQVDHTNRENSEVSFTVESDSIVCQDKWLRDGDRKKILEYVLGDGLLASKHPEITFASTKVKQKSDTTYDVFGKLIVRGIEKQISTELSIQPGSTALLEMMGISSFKLSDFAIKPPAVKYGLAGNRDEIVVDFELVASPKSQILRAEFRQG